MPRVDGAQLRELRIRKGWTLEALSVRSGVSERAIRDIESGATPQPRPTTIRWLAEALEVRPDELWDGQSSGAPLTASDARPPQLTGVVRDAEAHVIYRRPILGDRIRIGRDPELNHICLSHPSVSQVHAQIDLREHSLELRDLRSANGTYVNDKRVDDTCILQFGQAIRIGPFSVEIHRSIDAVSSPAETVRDGSHGGFT